VLSLQNILLIQIRPKASKLHKLQHQNQEGSQACSLPEQRDFLSSLGWTKGAQAGPLSQLYGHDLINI